MCTLFLSSVECLIIWLLRDRGGVPGGKREGARRKAAHAQSRTRKGSNDVRATVSESFSWDVLVKGLHTADRTPRLPSQPRRPLRHGDPRQNLSVTGYCNGRDTVGRPALFGSSDGAPEGRPILKRAKSALGRIKFLLCSVDHIRFIAPVVIFPDNSIVCLELWCNTVTVGLLYPHQKALIWVGCAQLLLGR